MNTIESFFRNTTVSDLMLNVHILLQRCSEEYILTLNNICEELQSHNNISIQLHKYDNNLGFSKANNALYELTKDSDYVLHIEDDWILLDSIISKDWLKACVQILDQKTDISTLILRKYITDQEKYQYGWTRRIIYYYHKHPDNFNYASKLGSPFEYNYNNSTFTWRSLPTFLFTFNPVIRRNCDYINAGVYPLSEYDQDYDEGHFYNDDNKKIHNAKHWGYCESVAMEKIWHLNSLYLEEGIFVHYDDWKASLSQ
jgi:hypothetical protein